MQCTISTGHSSKFPLRNVACYPLADVANIGQSNVLYLLSNQSKHAYSLQWDG